MGAGIMPSAWGGSWGRAWGNSWGSIAPVGPTRPSVGSPRDRTFIPLRKDALAEIRQRDDAEIAEIVNILFAVGVFDGK